MSECCASNPTVLLFACSGGSNVAQIANEAAKALDQRGEGRMYCAIGVAAGLPTFVETAKNADVRVLIDGCEVQCLKKAFDAAELPTDVHVVVSDLGISKGHHFNFGKEEVELVAGEVSRKLKSEP